MTDSEKWQKFAEKESSEETTEDLKKSDKSKSHKEKKSKVTQDAPGELDYPSRADLKNQLTAMEMKVTECNDQMKRLYAETENIRARSQREISKAHQFGIEKFVSDLLPVVDSFFRAIEGVNPTDKVSESMYEGMKLTLDMFLKALEKHGVKLIAPEKGEAFNPELHEAMSMVPDPKAKSHTIIEVLQRGYSLHGRVLRAAMVIVAK